jgi:hypothetical protein
MELGSDFAGRREEWEGVRGVERMKATSFAADKYGWIQMTDATISMSCSRPVSETNGARYRNRFLVSRAKARSRKVFLVKSVYFSFLVLDSADKPLFQSMSPMLLGQKRG